MTSTNDGKDVKSNQTSGHKSKSYYIELYTSLEKALSGGGSLEERTAHVCEAWRRVYSLYQHSATSTHPHLLSWLQRHTANTVLQPKWAKSKNEQARLSDAIDALVAEATAAATGRQQFPWEKLLLQRAAWFRKAVENPWDNPVLKSLINPNSEPVTDQQVLEWLICEHGIVLVTRLQRMVCAGNCDDLALLLASAVMDRARAALPHRADDRADDRVEEENPSSFVAVLEREASFTADEWEMLTDIELVLLLKTDKRLRCIELAKLTPLRHGYKMVERLRKRLETFPRDKKLWKHAKDVATIVAQSVITRCMVLGSCAGAGREALYWCARALARLVAGDALRAVCTKLAGPAATARHLHTFTGALSIECKELKTDVIMKPFICELYVRAITAGMNELEQLKLDAEKESEARLYERTLAGWFTQLGGRLTDSARLRAECALTAFSVHPARKHYEHVANMPPPPKLPQVQEPTPETTSEYGSWANDSRTQSNLVKTSETLQLKQSQQHQANVLSTAILTEGEALGLETVLCQDLAVLLSGPRVKTLSWDMDREVLLENCRSYMEKTHGGTRAVTTELKFLNLHPDAYRHLPEEGDDETDLFYGIEKGYEHEVQLEEPENIWQNAFFDPEQTESANDSEIDRQMKKKTKAVSSEDDEDPLSNIAEAKREKKKLAKEKSKERRKKSHTRDGSKDGNRERRKNKDKKTKKERKEDKSEHPTTGSLTSLLGMKVTKMSAQVQDGEKRVRKKKERRREPPTMFSYVSVTDSDYDSQGKSSQVFEHDPNVLVDGVFSMDELRSPERTPDSQKANTDIIKNNGTVRSPVINDIKTLSMSSPRVSTASDDSDVSRAKSPSLTPNQLGPRHVVSSKVKSSITKLLQYRKKSKPQVRDVTRPPPPTTPTHSLVGMKIYHPEEVPKGCLNKDQSKQLEDLAKEMSDVINEPSSSTVHYRSPETDKLQNQSLYNTHKYPQQYSQHHMQNTYNESQKHSEHTKHSPVRPAQQNISSQSPNSVIHANYSSPIKTPEHMRTHALNLTPPKPTMSYQPFHKSMQNLSTDTKYDSPKKPQLINDPNYFTQQHVNINSSQLSPRIISNTCIKPPSQTPNVQQHSSSVKDNTKSPQTYSNFHGMYKPRAQTNSQMLESKNDFIRYGQKQLSNSMQNIREPGHYEVTKSHIPTPNTLHVQATKSSSVIAHSVASTSQASYNSNTTASRCLPVQHRERVDKTLRKPNIKGNFEDHVKEIMSKISASNGRDKNLTIALNKDVKVTVTPSAKRIDSVTPQSAKQLIQQKKTENALNTFSRRSYMHKNKQSENKVNLTDAISLELNRSILDQKILKSKCIRNEVTISRVAPKTHGQNVVRKFEQPCSRLQKDCPVLSSMLDSTGTPKIQTVGNASQNASGNLANREDADLLLLLRNQSILKPNVSTIETLPSDVTSGQTLSNPQIKLEVSSAHLGLLGTKVKNINILEPSPVKRESEENKSLDWKCVMDALIAQKTEPLGPNALDLVLKKDRRRSQGSRSQFSDKLRVSGQTSHNKPSEPRKLNNNSSKASSSRKPSTEKHSDVTKKPRVLEIKNTTTQMLRPEDQKHFTLTIPKGVSQTTVIPNSDYDILDDLLDDDLRREIGEISSDEDTDDAPNAALPKGKTQGTIPKSVTNVCKAANIAKEKPHIVTKTIPKNETNTNIAHCNRRFTVTCPTTGYPNVINNSSRPTHIENKPTTNPEIMRQHTTTSTIITNQVAQDTANNIVTSHIESKHFVSNVIPANVVIASVPQPPVVVIRQDLVYDPYPTIRIHESQLNAELCTINQSMYALNAPNFAVYQTTQYAAPVINPVIIGNATTTTNVSNAAAMANDHGTPDMKDKQDEHSISLEEAIRLTDHRNDTPDLASKSQDVIRLSEDTNQKPEISTNLDFNMNRNCERKVLSQVQEKHPNDLDKDSQLKKSPVVSPLKTDEDRIKLKRQSLMNRKISHAAYHPPIPLTYTPLTKKINLEKQLQQETPKNGIVKSNLKSTDGSTNDIEKCVVISTSVKSPQSEANNENIESTDQVQSAKENQKTCRRIWLRSSNKIPHKLSPVKRSRVPLRRNKIKLKEREVIENAANFESENRDCVKNPTLVSNRILNKVKLIRPATNDTPAQIATQQNAAENNELIDFEAALCGSIVLKTPVTELGTANTLKQEPEYFNIMAEKKLANAEFGAKHKHLNSTEDTKVTSQSNRLEPTVVIEKLKSLGDQLIIKSSVIETPANEAKVIVMKNKNRTVLRKRIIQKCISTKESTPNKIIIKATKNTASSAIGTSVPKKSSKLKPVVILDQKVIKAPPIGSPLIRVESNKLVAQKVIKQISAAADANNESKPVALDNEIVADQKATKQTTTVSSHPVIDENNGVSTTAVTDKSVTKSRLDIEKGNKILNATVDNDKILKQNTSIGFSLDKTNKPTAVDDTTERISEQGTAEARDIEEKNIAKSRDDQRVIKQTGSTSDSSTTVQKRHSPDCNKVSSEIEVKNNQPQTSITTLPLANEKTCPTKEIPLNTVTQKQANTIIQSGITMPNLENSAKVNVRDTKLNESDTKPTQQQSPLIRDNVNVNHSPVTQKNCDDIIDISDDVQSSTEILKSHSKDVITNKEQQKHAGKSQWCQENMDEVVKEDAALDIRQGKQNVQPILNPKQINLPEQLNAKSKPATPTDNLKRYDELKAPAEKSAARPNVTDVPSKEKQTYMKDNIKIQELPMVDSNDPYKKLVRISLPNGKVFRATIHGKMQGGFDSLFAEPRMRSILTGSLDTGKRYTVNYKQVHQANKSNPSKILGTEIQDLNIQEAESSAAPIDTVNLISDDEDEVLTPPSRSFTTEFGKYTTNVDEKTFTLHQNRFNQKCEVKMHKEDIFKSNKTKPKRNFPSERSLLLTRNKRKVLASAGAPVEASTTTNIIPEVVSNTGIATQAQETRIPTLEQTNSTLTDETANVIEIDDSSNDSIENATPKVDIINIEPVKKLDELKGLLLHDLGVEINRNVTFPLPKEKTVGNLKSALLQDLGIATTEDSVIDITADDEKKDEMLTASQKQNEECLENHPVDDMKKNEEDKVHMSTVIQKQKPVDDTVQNDDKKLINICQEQDSLQKCVVRLVRCDNLVKKYEYIKNMNKCYIKLERLNNSILKATLPSSNENMNKKATNKTEEMNDEETDEMNQDNGEDFIEFDVEDPFSSPRLSRCPSLSILSNWDDDSQPLEIPYSSSPVMEIYDTIAQLRNKLKTELVKIPEKVLALSCDSEWTVTKFGYRVQEIRSRSDIPASVNNIVPDYDNPMVSGAEKVLLTFDAPKLLTIALKFFEDNPEVIYRLQSLRSLSRIITKKTTQNKLKRKTEELVSDIVASKILKLGTLALHSLNSCIKVLDVIRIPYIEENITVQPDNSSMNLANHVIVESLSKIDTISDNIERNMQIDEFMNTSYIENNEPEATQTDLAAECESHEDGNQTIQDAYVNEDINSPIEETMLICPVVGNEILSNKIEDDYKKETLDTHSNRLEKNKIDLYGQCENDTEYSSPTINDQWGNIKEYSRPTIKVAHVHKETLSSEDSVLITDSNTSPTDDKAEKCKKKTQDCNQCDNINDYSSPAIKVAHVHEETYSSEDTVPITDANTSSTDGESEKCNKETHDCNQRDNIKEYSSSAKKVAHVHEEIHSSEDTVPITDANTSPTDDKAEKCKKKTQDCNQCDNINEYSSPAIKVAHVHEETYSSEDTVPITDANTSSTDGESEKCNKETHDCNQRDNIKEYSSSAKKVAHVHEETHSSEDTVPITDANTSPTYDKTEKCKKKTQDCNQCDNINEYSSLAIKVAHVHEETYSSEDTVPITDANTSSTDGESEKCNKETHDCNQRDNIKEYSSPAIKVAHVHEETHSSEDTVPITDANTSSTDGESEKCNKETHDCNQRDNIKEHSSSAKKGAHVHEETHSSEDTVPITDANTSPTYDKTEKCKKKTQDCNQCDNINEYSSPAIKVAHVHEETHSSEDTVPITDANTSSTDGEAEKCKKETHDCNQCDNIKEYSSPAIKVAHVHEETHSSEDTVPITDANTSSTDGEAEKCKKETHDCNQCDNIKEYSSSAIKVAHVHEETQSSEDTVPITDANTSPTDDKTEKCKKKTQDCNQCDNINEYSNPAIKVAHVHEETHSSEDTVPITDSDTSPTDDKAEKCKEESQASKSKPENCNTDLHAQFEKDQENYKKCLTPAISIPLVSEGSNACSEENVHIADTDMSPTDNKTKEEKTIQSGDDIAKERSEPAHREVDLVTDEYEPIKIDENSSSPVNDNLWDETSNTCEPSETNCCDQFVTQSDHEVELPSQLSIQGDRVNKTRANVKNEEATDEISYSVNIDRLDEIPIDEIHHDVCEVEVVDTHIDDSLEIVETLHEKSHEPVTVSNMDSSEINNQDSAIKSPVFIDTKKIAFNYHDYTKQPKNKVNTTSSVIRGEEREVNNDDYLLTKECVSETGPCCTAKNNSEVNGSENCPLKSNPECKYELTQEDDLLTVKITTENNKDGNDTKTVFVGANDAEDEAAASICSDDPDDIDIKGFEFEDIYVFPLNQSAGNSNNTSNDSVGQESNSENVNDTVQDALHDIDFHVIEPEITYSRKRKVGMWDIRVPAKKYRKGKNIDCSKQTAISMAELAYGKEYKRLLEYCSSVKFSYTRPFHKECVEVDNLLSNWPIKNVNCDVPGDVVEAHLFVDLQDIGSHQPDPMTQTFVEEINYEYERTDATPGKPSSEDSEVNFNMGFGEGSGRVIQILKKGESNISAATLSDVKQSQPVLKSVDLDDCNDLTTSKDDQIKKIRQHVNFIELRDKVRTFFKKTSVELKSDLFKNTKDTDVESKCNDRFSAEEFPFDLCSLHYVKPLPTNVIVQVVQVGQLPVSAAAQNPVTCDPRVTQVSDASPSQCSVDNSPNDDSQSEIKTEYTELTTADLTLPLQEYAQHNQANLVSNDSNVELTEQTISLEMEIKAEESPVIKEEMPDIKEEKSNSSDTDLHTLTNATPENMDYSFENNTAKSDASSAAYDSSEQNSSETFSQQRQQNGMTEKMDQIAHAMNAAGITTTPETVTNTRAHALVNILSQKIRQGSVNTTQTTTNTYSKTTSINAMSLQQALAQILPPPLNHTGSSENNQSQSTPVGPQVLHIVQGKNASGNQITLVDNSQQSVINTPNATQVLHIVQNKNATPGQASNGTLAPQTNSFSGLSLVDAGLQQGGNQLLHIVNTGNQKTASPGQLLKRVNLLTNLANVQGSNEQKMVQFVCKSADGKAIQLNAPHQRSMVLRLQPIETPNVQTPATKPVESQEPSPSPTGSASSKESASQQEIKSRSIYEENYAKFIQNSSSKAPGLEKSTSLPKFNQAFGKPVFQDGQKHSEAANNNTHLPAVNTNSENAECPATDNSINLEHIGQISSPPLLLRKQPVVTSASQPNIVQQIKQTIAPMNIQTMHGGVIYTRQIPVNIGGGQTINLITVPSTELINDDSSKTQSQSNQGEIEPSIIKIVPQSQTTTSTESSQEESNNHASSNENAQTLQPQPVLTQMRIKLPMLSKAPQMVPGARVVRPSFFQIQRNVIGGANQQVYQQLVLTAAPPLGQQTIRLPQTQASRPLSKPPSESQSSSSESQMSTSTLEQLREFDMVLEQVKERSTVQPSTNSNNSSFKIHSTSSDTTDGNGSSNCSTESTPQVLYSIGNNHSLNVAYVNRKTTVTTPTTSTYVRSPDSSGIADSPTSSSHVQISHTVTTDSSPTDMSSQSKPAKVGSKSKSRPKSTSNPPNTLKLNSVPPKTSSQKPLEDEQTTQRILYILAEYKEQVENSPDKDKPAPRRRSNPPSNPGSSKRKKSSSSRRSGTRDTSPIHGEDTCRTMGSEDSSCGTSQGDCTESCLDSHSPQDSPRKVARKITFDQDITVTQPRPQPQRNVIVADGQTITVARGTGKPATAVLMPANYILPVSMVKGGQQIAIVTNRGPKLLTVGGEGGATNALLLQRLIGPAGLKPVLARPGVRHVRLPTAALHNLQAFNLATATTVQPPDSTASPTPGPTPPELVDTRATSSPWTDRDEVKPERGSSPEGSEPWNLPSSADAHEYSYEETVRTDNMDRTVLVVQKKDGSQRQHRLSHVSAAALRHKYAILEHELRLQKSLSEECEDLGVDSPSASELFPEAELLFAASPAHEHNQEHHSHTPQPLQSSIPQPDMDDQIATDHLIPREIDMSGLGDVGIVAVSEDGSATIALDQEEFARSHPNTTFHSEPTEGEVQPFTITGLKGRHITSAIFHSNSAPATVLMTAPQASVISQAPDHSVKYEIENMINSMPSSHNNDINLSSVLVKDDGLTRFDNILTDSRELHLTNTTSAIVHSSGNATQVIRRVCYEDDKRERDARYLIDEPDNLIAGDDAKMIAEDSSRDATLESIADVDDDRSSPERHAELFWESNSASERSEGRRPLDFSSDSDKCCKSPFDETNSTDSSGVGTHMRLDSVIKEARGRERSGSADGSSADDAHPPLRTYPPKRMYHPLEGGVERSLSGKTRAGERSPDLEVRRRASGRGVVKRGCHCCNGSPAPPKKKPRQRKPTLDFNATN